MYFYVNWFLKKEGNEKSRFFWNYTFLKWFHRKLKECVISWNTVFYISLFFSGTNLHRNACNTIFERYISALFKNLTFIDLLVILVEKWYETFWNFFFTQSLVVAFLWPANLMKMPLKVSRVYAHCTIKDQSLKKVL